MILTIAGKELKALFASPLAWVMLTFMQVLLAYSFLRRLDDFLQIQPRLIRMANPPGVTELVGLCRRGCVKKTMTSMAQSILSNHYIGKGALQKSDQPFDLMLSHKKDRAVFATYEGKVIAFDVDDLPYATEERIRLSATDYVIASFTTHAENSLLFVTQTGKVIHRESKSIETSKSSTAKGQTLIPPSRLEQGVRFMGAASAKDSDSIVVLDASGGLNLHEAGATAGAGSIEAEGLILSIGLIQAEGGKTASPLGKRSAHP